ncbi:unnamed protein product [Symbiodinium sp. KB8]|nr:unnamed protein product [Symbiodinium sp. KB8]
MSIGKLVGFVDTDRLHKAFKDSKLLMRDRVVWQAMSRFRTMLDTQDIMDYLALIVNSDNTRLSQLRNVQSVVVAGMMENYNFCGEAVRGYQYLDMFRDREGNACRDEVNSIVSFDFDQLVDLSAQSIIGCIGEPLRVQVIHQVLPPPVATLQVCCDGPRAKLRWTGFDLDEKIPVDVIRLRVKTDRRDEILDLNPEALQHELSDLLPDTDYEFHLRLESQAGAGGSVSCSCRTNARCSAPLPPGCGSLPGSSGFRRFRNPRVGAGVCRAPGPPRPTWTCSGSRLRPAGAPPHKEKTADISLCRFLLSLNPIKFY